MALLIQNERSYFTGTFDRELLVRGTVAALASIATSVIFKPTSLSMSPLIQGIVISGSLLATEVVICARKIFQANSFYAKIERRHLKAYESYLNHVSFQLGPKEKFKKKLPIVPAPFKNLSQDIYCEIMSFLHLRNILNLSEALQGCPKSLPYCFRRWEEESYKVIERRIIALPSVLPYKNAFLSYKGCFSTLLISNMILDKYELEAFLNSRREKVKTKELSMVKKGLKSADFGFTTLNSKDRIELSEQKHLTTLIGRGESLLSFPENLTSLCWLSHGHSLPFNFPPKLTELSLEYDPSDISVAQSEIIRHFPSTLVCLRIGQIYEGSIAFLPPNLTKLAIMGIERQLKEKSWTAKLPKKLVEFKLGAGELKDIDQLPPSLKFLEAHLSLNHVRFFPPNLCTIKMTNSIQQDYSVEDIKKLPHCLTAFAFQYPVLNQSIIPYLPKNLTMLSLGEYISNLDLPEVSLLSKLQIFIIHGIFTDTLIENLPSSLTHLEVHGFGNVFTDSCVPSLPQGLKHLILGGYDNLFSNQSVSQLPRSLIEIYTRHQWTKAARSEFPPYISSFNLDKLELKEE